MPERARVTSLEAIEDFRAKLIIYRDKAGRVLDEVNDDVMRTRLWLQTERPAHWQNQIRRLTRELEQRQQELFSAQLSGLRDSSYAQQAAVQQARRGIHQAEEKLKTTRQWHRHYDQRVEPLGRQVEKLRHTLGHDLGQAVAWLNEMTKTLSEYAELSPGTASATPAPPSAERVAANPPSPDGAAAP
jgi:chromosome segregation ATPase